jgi:hypothetical protein
LATLLAAAGYAGFSRHPDVSRPTPAEAGREIAESIELGPDGAFDVTGDYLVERYYGIDLSNGQRFVADIGRGRVRNVVVELRGDWTDYKYSLVLDRSDAQMEQARISALVNDAAPPPGDDGSRYLGLRAFPDPMILRAVNYDGSLTDGVAPFRGPEGEDVFTFLAGQIYEDVSRRSHLLESDGTNYLLTTTASVWEIRDRMGISRAVLMGHLLLINPGSSTE